MSCIDNTEGERAAGVDPFDGTSFRSVQRVALADSHEVFEVVHRVTGRPFLAKLEARGDPDAQRAERLRVEAQSLGRLSHPNILNVAAVGRTRDQRFFIVTERLEGMSLADEVAERGPLPLFEAVSCASQLLAALSAAHALGVVHRAVNPRAVVVCGGLGERRRIKLCDFGLVRVLPNAPEHAPAPLELPTDSGVVLGVPGFLSSEAASGSRADARSDIYSAGLVLYFMLAGRGLFDDLKGTTERFAAHALPAIASNRLTTPVPRELERVLLKALQPEPAERFQSADEFQQALDHIARDLLRPAAWFETTTRTPLEGAEIAPIREMYAADAAVASFLPTGAPLEGAVRAHSVGSLPAVRVHGTGERRRRLLRLFQLTALVSGLVAGVITFWVEGGLP